MKAILVFLDGTVCDMRHRIPLIGQDGFFAEENVLKDIPTHGSVECMKELAQKYHLIYIGARPARYVKITKKWLIKLASRMAMYTWGRISRND